METTNINIPIQTRIETSAYFFFTRVQQRRTTDTDCGFIQLDVSNNSGESILQNNPNYFVLLFRLSS